MAVAWAPSPQAPEAQPADRRLSVITNALDSETAYLPSDPVPYRTVKDFAKVGKTIVPCTRFVPEGAEEQVSTVLIPGFGGVEASYHKLASTMAANGQATTTYEHPDGSLFRPEITHAKSAYAVMRREVELQGTGEVDAVIHSMGGQTLASLHEDARALLRQAHLIATAGITAHDMAYLATRTPQLLTQEVIPAAAAGELPYIFQPRAIMQAARYIRAPWRIWSEGRSVSNCQIHDNLRDLRKSGVLVTATWLKRDVFFNADEGHYHTSQPDMPDALAVADYSEIFYHPEAGHSAPISNRFAPQIGRRVVQYTRHFQPKT